VQNLRNGMSTRSAPQPPAAYYPGMSHQQLYDAVTKNVSAGQIGSTASSWDQSSQDLIDASQSTASQALASSEQNWQGQAGNAARSAVAGLANQVGQAGQAAQVSAQLYQQQSDALSTATHTVPPPPAHPFNVAAAQQQLMATTNPFDFVALAHQDQAQFAAQQAAHQQAVTVVSGYDRVVSQTSQNQPGYAPAPPVASPGHSPSGGTQTLSQAATGGGGSSAPRLSNSRPSGSSAAAAAHGSSFTGATTPPVQSPGSLPGSTTTGTSDYTGTSTGSQPGTGWAPGGPGSGQSPTGPATGAPSGPGDVGVIPPMGGMSAGGGADIVRSGPGFGGGYGSGGGAGFGPTGSGGAGSGANGGGTGARSGVGAGAEAAEQNAVEEGAASSRSGAGMGAMPGGRGGRGEGDREHKRADYLQEPDVEGIFGTDQYVAPPVIGE
jgi:hypothetical protein